MTAQQSTGIEFSEKMEGPFAQGATEPSKGKSKGKSDSTKMAMRGKITIADIDRFIEDPDHVGELTGSIEFTPFGTPKVGKNGVFNLFSPTDDPKQRNMVYEMGFEHQGQDYYVAGAKHVKHDKFLDLWSDTTTLFTTLHEGTSKSGPIVGAGVLSLGIVDLAKMLRTFKVTDADNPGEWSVGAARFFGFFLGEVVKLYRAPMFLPFLRRSWLRIRHWIKGHRA